VTPQSRDSRLPVDRGAPNRGQRVTGWLFLISLGLLTYGMTPLTFNLDEIKVTFLFCLMPLVLTGYFVFCAKGECPSAPAPLNLLLGLYMLTMLTSTLSSKYSWIGWYSTGVTAASLGCYYGPIGFVRRRQDLEWLIFALVLICFGTIVFGMVHRLKLFTFLSHVFYNDETPRLMREGNPPRLYTSPMHGLIYTLKSADKEMLSTILNRDFFAGYLNMMVPVALALGIVADSKAVRRISLATVGLGVLCIYLAMSKNDYITLALTPVLFFGLYQVFVRYRPIRIPYWGVWAIGALVVFATVTFLRWSLFADKLKLFSPQALGRNLEARWIIWSGAWKMFLDHWLLGGGPGSFRVYFALYRHPDYLLNDISTVTLSSHNLYLDYLCETGIVGFILAMGFLAMVLFYSLRQVVGDEDRRLRTLQTGLFCSLAAILQASAFSPHTRWVILSANFYALLGTTVAAANIPRLKRPEQALPRWSAPLRRARTQRAVGWAAAAVSGALSVISFVFGVRYFAASVANNNGLIYLNLPENAQLYREATVHFENAVQLNPTFLTSFYKLASLYHTLSRLEPGNRDEWLKKALDTYAKLARLSPDYSEIHMNLGIVYEDKARDAYDKASQTRSPEEKRDCEEEERRCEEKASGEFTEAARQSSKLMAQRLCALAYQNLAAAYLREAARSDPQSAEQCINSGRALLEKALAIHEKLMHYDPQRPDVVAATPEGDPGLLLTQRSYGLLLEELGRDEKAVDVLYRLVRENPGDKPASDALARAMNTLADKQKVERVLNDLVASNPLRIDYRIYRFTLEMNLGRWEEAWNEAQKALKLIPGEPRSMLAAGEILLHLGRLDEARRYLQALTQSSARSTAEGKRAAQYLEALNRPTTATAAVPAPGDRATTPALSADR